MASIYVTSPQSGDGKTAVALGLLSLLGRAGVARYVRIGGSAPHPDAEFASRSLGLTAPPEEMTVAPGQSDALAKVLAGGSTIVEGDDAPVEGLPALLVLPFRGEATVGAIGRQADATRLTGAILTAVPDEQRRYVERTIKPAIEEAGVRLLGTVPETRALRAATVEELARHLQADVITGFEVLDNPIENYMVGAMSHAGANSVPYFLRKPNKAVITGGDRIDVHLGALATPCQCMILTGGYDPDPVVVERAEAEDVPLIKVHGETPETLERIGAFLRTVRFRQPHKVGLMAELLRQHVDLGPIESALGVNARAGV